MTFRTKTRELTGNVYGQLLVTGEKGYGWNCRCECGETDFYAQTDALLKGRVLDCGCVARRKNAERLSSYTVRPVAANTAVFAPQAKDVEYRNEALTRLAKDQACANCGGTTGTVSAHGNWSDTGKAASHKAHDVFVAWLDMPCHSWLDQGTGMDPTGRFEGTREGKREMWTRAAFRTWLEMWRQGLIAVVVKR